MQLNSTTQPPTIHCTSLTRNLSWIVWFSYYYSDSFVTCRFFVRYLKHPAHALCYKAFKPFSSNPFNIILNTVKLLIINIADFIIAILNLNKITGNKIIKWWCDQFIEQQIKLITTHIALWFSFEHTILFMFHDGWLSWQPFYIVMMLDWIYIPFPR